MQENKDINYYIAHLLVKIKTNVGTFFKVSPKNVEWALKEYAAQQVEEAANNLKIALEEARKSINKASSIEKELFDKLAKSERDRDNWQAAALRKGEDLEEMTRQRDKAVTLLKRWGRDIYSASPHEGEDSALDATIADSVKFISQLENKQTDE